MRRKPIRHHYIPQFILRSFRYDDEHLLYYDKIKDAISIKRPEEVFMERNLYRDSINHPDEPTKIETDFAKYEAEIAPIIKRFTHDKDILLTVEEDEKLKLFFALMSFRSGRMLDFFGDNVSEVNKKFYSLFQDDGDLIDFWKRNLAALVRCRSIREVMQNPDIDEPIQVFMLRDTFGFAGTLLMLLERRGRESFVLSDCYPVAITGTGDGGLEVPLYAVFPISPSHMIIQFSNGIESCDPHVTGFKKGFFMYPKKRADGRIRIRKQLIYEMDVHHLNQLSIQHAEGGVLLQDESFFPESTNRANNTFVYEGH